MTFEALFTSLQLVDIGAFFGAAFSLYKLGKYSQTFELEHKILKEDIAVFKKKLEDFQDKCEAHHQAHYCIKHEDILRFLNKNDS